jgi:hypothetical protein
MKIHYEVEIPFDEMSWHILKVAKLMEVHAEGLRREASGGPTISSVGCGSGTDAVPGGFIKVVKIEGSNG